MKETIYVIDDEEVVQESLQALLGVKGSRRVMTFGSALDFLEEFEKHQPGVILLDLHMPGMSGIELLVRLSGHQNRFPVIMVTGQGDVPLAVRAMRLGAIDFLEKPYDHNALFDTIDRAYGVLRQHQGREANIRAAQARIEVLSRREREVLLKMADGFSNREMADQMGLSVRTVEVHRANVMDRLKVASLPEAVKLVIAAGLVDRAAELT